MPRVVCVLVLAACAGCGASAPSDPPAHHPGPDGPEWFRDVTAEVGLDCRHRAGPTGDYFMPKFMGLEREARIASLKRRGGTSASGIGVHSPRREKPTHSTDRPSTSAGVV